MKIENENKFTIPANSFAISPSSQTYTLKYSVDGEHFDAYRSSVPANENCLVLNAPAGLFWKLVGNTSTVYVQY